MANKYNGHFVTDLIRCFDNRKNYIEIEFDKNGWFQICVGEHTFNKGKVLKLDNSEDTLTVTYGDDIIPPATAIFTLDDNDLPTPNAAGFFLMDNKKKKMNKLAPIQIKEIQALANLCVQEGDFFIEIYNNPEIIVRAF